MPGKKPKPKARALGPTGATRAVEELIAGVEDWSLLVQLLAVHYQLPDLSSKKGLKECYRNIDTISVDLREAFDETSNVRLKGGIVGIWGKLAYDAVIRNKLMEQGILKRITSTLDKEETLITVLQTLATITRHGGVESRNDVATAVTTPLVETLKSHTKNPKAVHLIVTILAHTVSSIYYEQDPIYKRFPSIKMQDILPVVHTALCDDGPTPGTFDHGNLLVMSAARHAYAALQGHQPSLDFIVACLRVRDLATRAGALSSILTYHLRHNNKKPTAKFQDFMEYEVSMQNLPSRLQEAMVMYGLMKCEQFVHIRAVGEYQKAQMEAAQTRNFYALGLKLAELIYRSEGAITEGYFQDEDGIRRDILGVPYDNFLDSLPVAARALRERDSIKHADAADMLQVKFCMLRRQYETARSMSEAAMARSPQEVYWYYVCSLLEQKNAERKLRWAKRGLASPQKSDYLRYCLLDTASRAAIQMAIEILETSERGSQRSVLALALLHSAKGDATTFVNEVPPDCRDLDEMLTILMCVTLVLKGNEINPDLREFKNFQGYLEQTDDFTRHIRKTFGHMQYRRTYETIIERYERAANFWDPRLESCNTHTMKHHHGPGNEYAPTEELQELFSSVNFDDSESTSTPPASQPLTSIGISYMNEGMISLYQCSFCGNCSAALKKCSRCGQVRYCDTNCQKDHWKSHKPQCVVSC